MKKDSSRMAAAGTLAVCVIAILFSVMSAYSAFQMHSATAAVYEHPYTVSNAAYQMRSRLLDMKQFMSYFLTSSFTSVEDTEILLQARYSLQQESIDTIGARYLGPAEDVDALQQSMDSLIEKQSEAVRYAAGHVDEETLAYVQNELYPYYDAVSGRLDTVIAFADAKVISLERLSQRIAYIEIIAAAALTIIIIGFTIRTNRRLEQRRHQDVAYREKLFDLLASNVDDVFFIYSLNSRGLEYVSSNSERILGLNEAQFTDSHVLQPLMPPEDAARLDELFKSGVIRTQAERDFRLGRPEGGDPRWMNLKIYPLTENGQVARYIISISDQTERILIQQNLKDALTVAQNANRAKKDFLSRMSHEIRTPMNAIIGMTAIAAAHIDDRDRVEDCLSKIGFSSKHLLSLINDVLDMSKIEEGKFLLSHEPFAFRQLMESITAIVCNQAREQGLNFDVALVDFTHEVLIGDALRLNQILLNLLSNAVKFTPKGGYIRLEVRQLSVKNGQARIRFTVSDTGIGMSGEFLQRLFTPFEQADSSISQRFGGTGLGMSITKNLVTLLGGALNVKSALGEGSVFTVELPFTLEDGEEESLPLPKLGDLESLRVLVADDDRDTCIHASILLEKLGIASEWVLSGAEAVSSVLEAHAKGEGFDVCLIDLQMPGMDGVETTRRVRERLGPETIIIIISAYDWAPIEETARQAGANAFISKPMFASTLYNTLLTVTNITPAAPRTAPVSKKYCLAGKRVLLVEDNDLNREIAVEILAMAQIQVECARDGQEAVDLVLSSEKGHYDLVLMDIQMPVMNGYDATRTIRASSHPQAGGLPIVAMTANAFSEDMSAALAAGMNGHIPKPIDISLLYQTMDKLLKG